MRCHMVSISRQAEGWMKLELKWSLTKMSGVECQRQPCFPRRGHGVQEAPGPVQPPAAVQKPEQEPREHLCLSHCGMDEPEHRLVPSMVLGRKEMRLQLSFQGDSATFPEPYQRLGRAEEKLQQSWVLR